ncbi:NAD(P)/FAD-dependent oxidoreductase [Marinobacter pelagius]|uniref:p-cumate 2,3-dioxygenase ferredoxin reductase subunit n=1 Tax=Marinobacter pelagius TaxID=379482 RepID=A0A1I4XFB3_9GAMM|nr:FAD-dependent oxidoreductase [Marinobacter pelagius]SFN24584.1 p-cumate 2,3-dioxygenase ferredoxin reductase subunit [Marinobacter pelagius]
MSTKEAHIIIVGAGQAGAASAMQLRADGFNGTITLIGEECHLPYERPQLSKELLLQDNYELKSIHAYAEFEQSDITLILGRKVIDVRSDQQTVVLDSGQSLKYDFLIIASGVRPRALPNIQGENIIYLRTFEEAQKIKSFIHDREKLVIIGGGVIGLEVAAAALVKECDVTVIEASDRLMARSLTHQTSNFLQKIHSEKGIKFKLGVGVERVDDQGELILSDGTTLIADKVLVAVGVIPNSEPFSGLGITDEFGIRVDRYGRTSIPNIFATGDIASQPQYGSFGRVETWANAQQHAVTVARNIIGKEEPYDKLTWFWSDQGDLNLQVVGTCASDHKVARLSSESQKFSEFALDKDSKLVGCISFNSPKDIAFARKWIQKSSKLDANLLADPSVNLKQCEIR